MSKIRFVGLDVHADTIAVAVAESGGEVRSLRDSKPLGIDSKAHRQAGPDRVFEGLLRSGANRLCPVLAAHTTRGWL